MEEKRQPRYRFRLGTLLLIVAILALLLATVIQQVQINRQQAQIKQMRQEIDRNKIDKMNLQEIIRVRAGSSSDGVHR
jgi:hypothetical protein